MASYYVWSGAAGSANGTSWVNAYTTLTTAFSGKVAGDVFYVAHDHAETSASAVTLTTTGTIPNPSKVICVNRAGSVPPVSADRRTTGQVSTTATANLSFNGSTHFDGIIFSAGSGTSSSCNIQIGNTASSIVTLFDNCSLRLGINSAGASKILCGGSTAGGSFVGLNNTTVSFANAAHSIQTYVSLRWRNTPSALLGTMPTQLFSGIAFAGCLVECIGVDFSAAGAGTTIVGTVAGQQQASVFRFSDCKLNALATRSTTPSATGEVDFIRCGATAINYTVFRHRAQGALDQETTIVHTGGASDGTTPISWKVVTTANCSYSLPFECPPIAIWSDAVGTPVTATVEGIAATLPTDQEVWLDVEYLGDASSPQGSFVNDGKADLLATAANQTSSAETWGGSTAAFKLAVTFTPQQKGWIYSRVKIGKASSTIYIDPLITLT